MGFPLVEGGESRDYEQAPAGNHLARCYMVIDLGRQKTQFQGTESIKRQLLLGFELSQELMADGRPFAVSNTYSFSLGAKANLRRVLEGWRGKPFTDEELSGFDVSVLAGKPCMVQVSHRTAASGKTYTNIQTVAGLPKGLQAPEAINDTIVYSPYDHNDAAWAKLPNWIRRRIEARVVEDGGNSQPFDDEIPF